MVLLAHRQARLGCRFGQELAAERIHQRVGGERRRGQRVDVAAEIEHTLPRRDPGDFAPRGDVDGAAQQAVGQRRLADAADAFDGVEPGRAGAMICASR
jgi:hypothetical protein